MEVFIDSSFIISCVKKRIDFLSELEEMGFKPIVPREVLQELKDLKDKKISRSEKEAIEIAFKMIDSKKVKKKSIGNGLVDDGLIAKGRNGIYIATLDKEIKRNVSNRIVIDSARNSLLVDRD